MGRNDVCIKGYNNMRAGSLFLLSIVLGTCKMFKWRQEIRWCLHLYVFSKKINIFSPGSTVSTSKRTYEAELKGNQESTTADKGTDELNTP